MRADATLEQVSQMVFCLAEIALTGSRGKALRNMRYYRADDFDAETVHRKPPRGAAEPPVSLLCDGNTPRELVLGWSPGSSGTAQKNGKFARIDVGTAILPEAPHLIPLITGGLAQLCDGLSDGQYVLQNKRGEQFGRDTLADLFRRTFGHPIGDDKQGGNGGLRMAIENRARELYEAGTIDEAQCGEVHKRLQHDPETAMSKYTTPTATRRLVRTEREDDDDSDLDLSNDSEDEPESDAETLDLPDAVEPSSDEEAPPPLARTGPTTAVGGIALAHRRGSSPPPRARQARPAPAGDIADRIEALLRGGAEGCVAACIALHRHKRARPDDDVEWLGTAVCTAKRACGC
jgi:hypothetical protein